MSTLTKASLLCGRTGRAGGLLLTHFGNGRGLLLVKDVTTILSEATGTRTEIIATLREVYDRHITRAVGTRDNLLTWNRQISFLGAVTEEIEQHRATIALMGERFVYVPMPAAHEARAEIARTAITQARQQHEMRNALAIAVRDFFGQLPGGAVSDLSPADVDWLAACATFGSHARSPILRDPRNREIELAQNRRSRHDSDSNSTNCRKDSHASAPTGSRPAT